MQYIECTIALVIIITLYYKYILRVVPKHKASFTGLPSEEEGSMSIDHY